MEEIIGDGHADAQDETCVVAFEHLFHVSFGFRVEGLGKVGFGLLEESHAGAEGMGVVVLEYASGGVDRAVNVVGVADVGDVEGADDVGSDGLRFVVFAPVDVWAARDSCCHKNV
mmetsp:Transcript_16940/g.23972  ORF Transcript_16940/g.23972 Transcript_16940/m.23972 type:complete len:115 (-) Transcript_16940:215-559(-)